MLRPDRKFELPISGKEWSVTVKAYIYRDYWESHNVRWRKILPNTSEFSRTSIRVRCQFTHYGMYSQKTFLDMCLREVDGRMSRTVELNVTPTSIAKYEVDAEMETALNIDTMLRATLPHQHIPTITSVTYSPRETPLHIIHMEAITLKVDVGKDDIIDPHGEFIDRRLLTEVTDQQRLVGTMIKPIAAYPYVHVVNGQKIDDIIPLQVRENSSLFGKYTSDVMPFVLWDGTSHSLLVLERYTPEVLKHFGIEVTDGSIYNNWWRQRGFVPIYQNVTYTGTSFQVPIMHKPDTELLNTTYVEGNDEVLHRTIFSFAEGEGAFIFLSQEPLSSTMTVNLDTQVFEVYHTPLPAHAGLDNPTGSFEARYREGRTAHAVHGQAHHPKIVAVTEKPVTYTLADQDKPNVRLVEPLAS